MKRMPGNSRPAPYKEAVMPDTALQDTHGRIIDYMRISVTDRCNFRCVYCMPKEGEPFIPHAEILSYEELLRICRITSQLGISRYKITGGEPLCRKDVVSFIKNLKSLPGVRKVTLTTNGALLGTFADRLAEAGVETVNVSLDSLTQRNFNAITRSAVPVKDILAAMAKAKARGLRIKINVVPLDDFNRDDLAGLARHAVENGYHIRFIELMPVGLGLEYAGTDQSIIRQMAEREFGPLTLIKERMGNGPAICYSVEGSSGSIGFISALSDKFCRTCNRVRLTSSGFLKTCLHHDVGINLRELLRGGVDDAQLEAAIRDAVAQKPMAHNFSRLPGMQKTALMHSIGG